MRFERDLMLAFVALSAIGAIGWTIQRLLAQSRRRRIRRLILHRLYGSAALRS
jgi:hypothetical protein